MLPASEAAAQNQISKKKEEKARREKRQGRCALNSPGRRVRNGRLKFVGVVAGSGRCSHGGRERGPASAGKGRRGEGRDVWVRLRRGGVLRRRVKASRGAGGRQGGAGRLSAPGRAIGARRARARSLRLPGPAWVRSCSTAAGGATAHGSPAPGAAALAPAACRGEGGRAVACRLVVAGARRRPGALSPLRETQPVVPHCAGEVRGVEERARAACGDGGGDGPTSHRAGVASVGVAVARVAPG